MFECPVTLKFDNCGSQVILSEKWKSFSNSGSQLLQKYLSQVGLGSDPSNFFEGEKLGVRFGHFLLHGPISQNYFGVNLLTLF